MEITRRMFLEGVAVTAGVSALGMEKAGEPVLKLGIVSDIHLHALGSETYFVKTLNWFKSQGVDGVIVAGDMADRGLIPELQLVADSWYSVFPNDKADDGRHVEKLFVYGNHDIEGFKYFKLPQNNAIVNNLGGNWEKCFHEPWSPIYAKTIKGYTFIGQHWGNQKSLKDFVDKTVAKVDPSLPFFYAQHAHPINTCYGSWAWGAWDDQGAAKTSLSPYPNAVAFSGHSHYSLTDERTVWQGTFTSIGTSSLSYTGMPYGRENGEMGNSKLLSHMPHMQTRNGKQGMLLSVYRDRMVLRRREFVYDEALGPDWILPLPCRGGKDMPFTYEKRMAQSIAPEFSEHAKLSVVRGKGKNRRGQEEEQITVSFPRAVFHNTRDRIFDYEVQAQILDCDTIKPFCTKRVFAEGYYLSDARIAKKGSCIFALSELPQHETVRFSVRPAECFGKMGHPIYSEKIKLD